MSAEPGRLSLRRKLAFSLVVITVCFVGAELVLRLLTTGSLYLFESNPHFADADGVMRLKPGSDTWWYGFRYEVNSQGFRMSAEVGPKLGLRVLAIGDSITEGMGVRDTDDVWPSLLEQMGGGELGAIQVINSGVQSWDLLKLGEEGLVPGEFRKFLEQSGKALEPDIVVYAICLNDSPSAVHRVFELDNRKNRRRFAFFPERAREWLKRKAIYRLLRDVYRESRFRSLDYSAVPTEASAEVWQRVSREIAEMKRLVEGWGATFVAVVIPYSYQLLPQHAAMLQQNANWHRALESSGVPYRDITASLDQHNVLAHFALGDYIHLNEKGHALVAQAAYELIEEQSQPAEQLPEGIPTAVLSPTPPEELDVAAAGEGAPEPRKQTLVSAPGAVEAGGLDDAVAVMIDDRAARIPIRDGIFGVHVSEVGQGAFSPLTPYGEPGGLRRRGIRSLRSFGCGADTNHWRTMVGPVSQRRRFAHSNPCYAGDVRRLFDSSSVFPMNLEWGIDELFEFASRGGAEMVGTVNFGTGTAREAANFVEYANLASPDPDCDGGDGDMARGWKPDSYSGAAAAPPGYFACLRHFFGREEPYRVRYWEVGNEIAGQSSPTWTSDTKLYFDGGSAPVRPSFVTRDALRLDWSGKQRQTTCSPNERFYVQFPPIAPAFDDGSSGKSRAKLELQLLKTRRECGIGGNPRICRWSSPDRLGPRWNEVTSLGAAGPRDRVFQVDPSGAIQFGDGVKGAIPPCLSDPDRGYEVVLVANPSGPHDGFDDFEAAMKAVDPEIRVGSGHPFVPPDAARRASLDFIVAHPYMVAFGPDTKMQRGMNEPPDLSVFRPALMSWSRRNVVPTTNRYREEFGRDVEIAWTEWNLSHAFSGVPPTPVYTTSLDAGIFVADMLRTAIELRISLANFLGLAFTAQGQESQRQQGHGLATLGGWKQTAGQRQLSMIVQPAGLVFEMFGEHFGTEAFRTEVIGSPEFSACWPTCTASWGGGPAKEPGRYPQLEALASLRADGRMAVLLINKSRVESLDIRFELKSGASLEGSASWVVLNSEDQSADPAKVTNSAAQPHAVSLTTQRIEIGSDTRLTIPSHSVSIIVLPGVVSREVPAVP